MDGRRVVCSSPPSETDGTPPSTTLVRDPALSPAMSVISRRRIRVRQVLERSLALIASLVFVAGLLRVYGIDQIFMAAVTSVLTASLDVGALSISVGDVVVFFLTVWLSFVLARFVHIVLQDDVFPRVRLARGVPYAIQSLVRYSIIFLGFLSILPLRFLSPLMMGALLAGGTVTGLLGSWFAFGPGGVRFD